MNNLRQSLNEINEYIRKSVWMDFSYDFISEEKISIIGSLDLSWKDYHSLELVFVCPTQIHTILSEWHKPEKKILLNSPPKRKLFKNLEILERIHALK